MNFLLVFGTICVVFGVLAFADPVLDAFTANGYTGQAFTATSKDGYITTVYRIPPKDPRLPPLVLWHGVLSNAIDWLHAGKGNSLAYLASDQGYDVWIPSTRGTAPSRGHTNLTAKANNEYWEFSWDDIALNDIPAVLDVIETETGHDKVHYIGHSMGTTQMMVLAATVPEYAAKRIINFIALAPVAYITHAKTPILNFAAPFIDPVDSLRSLIGYYELVPRNDIFDTLGGTWCAAPGGKDLCSSFLFLAFGYDEIYFNRDLIPQILEHDPAGTSSNTLIHYARNHNSGKFSRYDHGMDGNLIKYGTPTAPEIDIAAITIPIDFFYSDNDWLAAVEDVHHFAEQVPSVKMHFIEKPGWNHLDFLFAIDVGNHLHQDVLNVLNSYRK